MRRPIVIVAFFLLSAGLLWLYFHLRLPPGVEAKGGADSLVPWISLAGSFVSLLTGFATLALKIVELRAKLASAGAKEH